METLRDVMMSGRDINQWHKQQMRKNNFNWFMIFILCVVMWFGHSMITHKRYEYTKEQLNSKEALVQYQQMQIDTLQQAVDSAVYFNEIISKK